MAGYAAGQLRALGYEYVPGPSGDSLPCSTLLAGLSLGPPLWEHGGMEPLPL